MSPRTEYDRKWLTQYPGVIGIDEVGRGPGAGPVMVGGVFLNNDLLDLHHDLLELANDSKALSDKKRRGFFDAFMKTNIPYVTTEFEAAMVDKLGIDSAINNCFIAAGRDLLDEHSDAPKSIVLVDGDRYPGIMDRHHAYVKTVIKGDATSCAIACASILAKVTRDSVMQDMDLRYPGYGFGKHAGYLTPQHLEALKGLGPCAIHRMSFEPMKSRYT